MAPSFSPLRTQCAGRAPDSPPEVQRPHQAAREAILAAGLALALMENDGAGTDAAAAAAEPDPRPPASGRATVQTATSPAAEPVAAAVTATAIAARSAAAGASRTTTTCHTTCEAVAPMTASLAEGTTTRRLAPAGPSGPSGRVYIAPELTGLEPCSADDLRGKPAAQLRESVPASFIPARVLLERSAPRGSRGTGGNDAHHLAATGPYVGRTTSDGSARSEPDPGSPRCPDRARLLRDLRRIWMGPAFRKEPHALIAATVDLVETTSLPDPAADTVLSPARHALLLSLGEEGTAYPVARHCVTVIVPGAMMPQALQLARDIMSAGWTANVSPDLTIAAGVAVLHRDEDPVTALCLAEANCCVAKAAKRSARVADLRADGTHASTTIATARG